MEQKGSVDEILKYRTKVVGNLEEARVLASAIAMLSSAMEKDDGDVYINWSDIGVSLRAAGSRIGQSIEDVQNLYIKCLSLIDEVSNAHDEVECC